MAPAASSEHQWPVVVWGGGTGGVAAALQAARGGASTLLLTPGSWLGGMVSAAGVCAPDGNELTPWQTGLWGAFLRELQCREPEGLDQNWVSCFGYRPSTAEAILRDWCQAEPLLQWWPGVEIDAVRRSGKRITGLDLRCGAETRRVDLDVLIDGSDLGDLFPLVDAPYRLGWEAKEQWGEPSAPSQSDLDTNPFYARQRVQSPTWVVMGQLKSATMPPGTGKPKELPAGPFEHATKTFGLERTITYGRLPGGLVMLNWPLDGNDWHGPLDAVFGSDPLKRDELFQQMQAHSLLFAEQLQTATDGWLALGACYPSPKTWQSGAPGTPELALQGASPLALMPYWREGRRLVGHNLVLEQDLLPQGPGVSVAALPTDGDGQITSIAVGNYANDHHYPGDDYPLAPKSTRWGGRWSGTPFAIPYGALVSSGIDNLLAADKCISVSHMANGATRLQPLVLNLGQACGAAAALCVKEGLAPAELPVRRLQQQLIDDRQAPAAVVPLWDTPWHHPNWRQRQAKALDGPSTITPGGSLDGDPALLSPADGPAEPGESAWTGTVIPKGEGEFCLEQGTKRWPLITLEPALNHWLESLERPTRATLVGKANPWGPWLRASRHA